MDAQEADRAEAAEILRRVLADPGELRLTPRQEGYLAGVAEVLSPAARGGRRGSRG